MYENRRKNVQEVREIVGNMKRWWKEETRIRILRPVRVSNLNEPWFRPYDRSVSDLIRILVCEPICI